MSKRAEGLWWVRINGSRWRGGEVMDWSEFVYLFGSQAASGRTRDDDGQAVVIDCAGISEAYTGIEWGPFLDKGPMGSLDGLVAWLVAQGKIPPAALVATAGPIAGPGDAGQRGGGLLDFGSNDDKPGS